MFLSFSCSIFTTTAGLLSLSPEWQHFSVVLADVEALLNLQHCVIERKNLFGHYPAECEIRTNVPTIGSYLIYVCARVFFRLDVITRLRGFKALHHKVSTDIGIADVSFY